MPQNSIGEKVGIPKRNRPRQTEICNDGGGKLLEVGARRDLTILGLILLLYLVITAARSMSVMWGLTAGGGTGIHLS